MRRAINQVYSIGGMPHNWNDQGECTLTGAQQ